jgi:hypothetical protein
MHTRKRIRLCKRGGVSAKRDWESLEIFSVSKRFDTKIFFIFLRRTKKSLFKRREYFSFHFDTSIKNNL